MKQKLIALLGWLLSRLDAPQQPPEPETDHLSATFDRFTNILNAGECHPITALIRSGAANLPAYEFDTFFVMVSAARRRNNPFRELECFTNQHSDPLYHIPFSRWVLFLARSAWNAEFAGYSDLDYLDFINKILNPVPYDRTVDEHHYSKVIKNLTESWEARTDAESWSGTAAWVKRDNDRYNQRGEL